MTVELENTPVIDRETIEMLRAMDMDTDEESLVLELVDEYLVYATGIVEQITLAASAEDAAQLATSAHALKGASLNIGALVLFQVCNGIEQAARNGQLTDAAAPLRALPDAFTQTVQAFTELRNRTARGEAIDDLF